MQLTSLGLSSSETQSDKSVLRHDYQFFWEGINEIYVLWAKEKKNEQTGNSAKFKIQQILRYGGVLVHMAQVTSSVRHHSC